MSGLASHTTPTQLHKRHSKTRAGSASEGEAAHAPTKPLLPPPLVWQFGRIARPWPGQQQSRRAGGGGGDYGAGQGRRCGTGAVGGSHSQPIRSGVRPAGAVRLPRRRGGGFGAEGGRDVRGGPELRRRVALRDVRGQRQRAAALHPRRPRRPADQGARPAVQPVRVADDAQLVRAARAAVPDGGRHRHALEPAGHRHRPAQQRRAGPDAGHVRLPQRHLALPLLRRHLPELHRIPTGGERAPRGGAVPDPEPGRGGDHLRGGLRGVPHGPDARAQRVGPGPLHVPGLAHAQERRRLAAPQRHGPRQPPPPRLHLQGRQGGRRGHRLRVALRRREPVRDKGDGEGGVPQPGGVGGHERRVEVAGAGELLQGPAQLPRGVQGQLGAAHGRARRLPRQVRRPLGQLHRRRLLQEERSRRRGGGHGQGQRRPGLRMREHLGLQRQRHVHSPARQDAQRHLQRLVRRRGVAAAAGAAVAAARPATCSPRCTSGSVNSHILFCTDTEILW